MTAELAHWGFAPAAIAAGDVTTHPIRSRRVSVARSAEINRVIVARYHSLGVNGLTDLFPDQSRSAVARRICLLRRQGQL